MSLLGLFGSGGLLDSKDSGGLLGKHFSPNMPLLMTGLGMMGGGWGGALPGLQAGMQHQRQAQGVKDWESVIGGMGGGQGAPQPGMPMPAVPSPMPGIGGPSPATPAATFVGPSPASPAGVKAAAAGRVPDDAARNTYALAIQAGMPPMQAAVWAGNVQQESSFNPGALNKGEGAFGLIQWRESRRRQLEEFARKRGTRPDDPETQARFSLWEMTEGPPEQRRPGQAFLAAKTPEEANQALKGYIRYGDNSYGTRLNNARNFLGGSVPAPQAAGGGGMPSPQQQQAFVNSLPPEEVQALARLAQENPQVASAILQQKFKAQQPQTEDQREFLFALQRGEFKGTFPEFLMMKKGGEGSTGFTLGRDQVRHDAQGNVIARGPEGTSPDKTFDQEAKLRGEFTKATTEFNTVQDAFGRVTAAVQERAKNPDAVSPASDIALVFGFMKMLDPSSVVREGEYATAQNAAGVPERIRNIYNKAVDGEFLTGDQRQDMVGTAGRLYGQARQTAEAIGARYRDLATGYQVDPDRVVSIPKAIEIPRIAERGAQSPEAAPAPGQAAVPENLTPEAISRFPLARTPAEAAGFPSGTVFRDPNNKVRRVP